MRTRLARGASATAAALALLVPALAGCESSSSGGGGGSTAIATPTARTATASVNDVNGAKASAACVKKVKTLRVATVGVLNDTTKNAQALLQKLHPGLQVQVSATAGNYDQVVSQIGADKAAGRLTDVAVANFDLLPVFERQLGAQPISPKLLRASYDQRLLKLGQIDGKQIGIPQQVSAPVLLYNKAVLQRAGVDPATLSTTTSVIAAADKIKKLGGIQPIDLPTGQQFGYWFLNALVASTGTKLQTAGGQPNFTAPAFTQAAQFLKQTATYGTQSDDPTRDGLIRFGTQKTAIVGATVASVGAVRTILAGRGKQDFQLGVLPFPALPGGKPAPVAGGNALVILSKDQCQRELATEMVVALLSPDVLAAGVQAVSYVPVDTKAKQELTAAGFYTRNPDLDQFVDDIPSFVPSPEWGGARGGEVPQDAAQAVVGIRKGGDPAAVLAGLQTTVTGLVK